MFGYFILCLLLPVSHAAWTVTYECSVTLGGGYTTKCYNFKLPRDARPYCCRSYTGFFFCPYNSTSRCDVKFQATRVWTIDGSVVKSTQSKPYWRKKTTARFLRTTRIPHRKRTTTPIDEDLCCCDQIDYRRSCTRALKYDYCTIPLQACDANGTFVTAPPQSTGYNSLGFIIGIPAGVFAVLLAIITVCVCRYKYTRHRGNQTSTRREANDRPIFIMTAAADLQGETSDRHDADLNTADNTLPKYNSLHHGDTLPPSYDELPLSPRTRRSIMKRNHRWLEMSVVTNSTNGSYINESTDDTREVNNLAQSEYKRPHSDSTEKSREEWILIAVVLDSLLFRIFLVLLILTTCIVFIVPTFQFIRHA